MARRVSKYKLKPPVKTEREAAALARAAASEGADKLGQELKTAARSGDALRLKALVLQGANVHWQDADGTTPLIECVRRGDGELIQFLLDHGASPSGIQGFHPPLIAALYEKRTEIVTLLLKRGADPDEGSKYGETPMAWAVKRGDEPMVRLLLKHGASIEGADREGRTPLYWAESQKLEKIIQLLRENGAASVQDRLLMDQAFHAAGRDDLDALKAAMKTGADVNGRAPLLLGRKTLLMAAAASGALRCAAFLLSVGADLHAVDSLGRSALFYAAEHGDVELIDILIMAGADVKLISSSGWSPLMMAAFEGQTGSVMRLVELGAPIDHQNDSKESALILACQNRKNGAARRLIELGANVNLQDASGCTAIMYAVRDLAMVKLLVKHGADLTLQDCDGDSVASRAKALRLKPVTEYLTGRD